MRGRFPIPQGEKFTERSHTTSDRLRLTRIRTHSRPRYRRRQKHIANVDEYARRGEFFTNFTVDRVSRPRTHSHIVFFVGLASRILCEPERR